MTNATKTQNTENTMAIRMATLADGWDNAEIAGLATDASLVAFAAATLVLGASGYASAGTHESFHANDFGSVRGGFLALEFDRLNGPGKARKMLKSGAKAKSPEMTLEAINAAIDAADIRITAELAEMSGANCATCEDFASNGRSFKCRTHAR